MQNESTRVVTTVRLEREMLERIDAAARESFRSRNAQIEYLLSTAVPQRERESAPQGVV